MKRFFILIMLFLIIEKVQVQSANDNPYTIYLMMKKELSELEWRLVQVNLKLGETGYFVYFDKISNIFNVVKFVDTYTLVTIPTSTLRESLVAKLYLVESVIGSEFQVFRDRKSKDLNVTFIIGESSGRNFANYSSNKFSFTDDYYNFRREHDK